VTIGVNDIQRHSVPDHLMIMDDHRAFTKYRDRQAIMEDPQFNVALWWRFGAPLWPAWKVLLDRDVRRYKIRRYKSPETIAEGLRAPNAVMALPHSQTTVYAACSLAVVLGATWVGVIGLDLVGDRRHLRQPLLPVSDHEHPPWRSHLKRLSI